jgi:uncharacterized membrane protein YeaQ/YmgE (transglycosylase-associated protein family)
MLHNGRNAARAASRHPNCKERQMYFIPWLVAGAVAGWVGGRLMRGPGGASGQVAVGVIGALLGGWLLGPMLGAGMMQQGGFGFGSLGVSLLGAFNLMVLVKLAQQSSVR